MFRIEKAKKKDFPEILSIENLSFTNPWSKNQFGESLSNFFVAKKGGKILGFIGVQKLIDEAHILHMATHPDYRRTGIARKLMRKAMGVRAKKFFLEVRKSNIPAQNLYKSMGFRMISIRNKYYSDNDEDALVMIYERPERSVKR